MNARGILAIGVLAAWGAGIAAFAQRELSRSPRERLAEAATRVAPGATYFAVERDGKHVGFASTTIDTIAGGLKATDYFVADLVVGDSVQRTTAQSVVHLSRGLALRDFAITFGTSAQPTVVDGRIVGDTLLEYSVRRPVGAPTTTRVRLGGPLLLPTQVPLAIALGTAPKVGDAHTVDTFDPITLTVRTVNYALRAESLFVLVDSAAYDAGTKRWAGVHADTVHGWHLVSTGTEPFDGWTDNLGRMISVQAASGLTMRRVAYEMAFENWRTSSATSGERFPNDSAPGQLPENALHKRIVVGRLQAPTELAQGHGALQAGVPRRHDRPHARQP
ncbi:MAG: hypothetical protein ABIT38_03655 [Gemmatimonadaceae bacterium]